MSKTAEEREVSPGSAFEERTKLHGVMTKDQVEGYVERTGTPPFTFASALAIMCAGIFGGMIVPWWLETLGMDVRTATALALPPLLALGLAVTRYFVDSKRGLCRGFWLTLAVAWAAALVVLLALFR